MIKVCTGCKINKELSEYHQKSKSPDGYYPQCKICKAIVDKQYYQLNKNKIKHRVTNYYKENSITILAKKDKTIISERNKKNKAANKDKTRVYNREYKKNRCKTDPQFLLITRLRKRLDSALRAKSWKKNTKFSEYIGCTLVELEIHIEKQFWSGMTWENHGKTEGTWNIYHILPLSKAKTEEELYKRCHYTNLQPLWKLDNIKKGNKE